MHRPLHSDAATRFPAARMLPCITLLLATFAWATPLAAQTVEAWQKAAVQKHPALAQAGSPLNQRFLALIAEKRKSDPAFFANANWPVRAADSAAAALQAEEQAASDKAKAEEEARLATMSPEERAWDRDKAHWVFERLVFGDNEDAIVSKLNHSKRITSRAAPTTRAALDSRFQWVLGESKFYLDFDTKDGLAAINVICLPQRNDNLDGFIHDDWGKLRAAAIEQFGPPAKTIEYPPDAKALKSGGWTVTDTWERPGCRIKFGLLEDGGKTSVALRISDPARVAD